MLRRVKKFIEELRFDRKVLAQALVVLLPLTSVVLLAPAAKAAVQSVDTALSGYSGSYFTTTDEAQVLPKTGDFTAEAWFKPSASSGTYAMLFSQGKSGTVFYLQDLGGSGRMNWQYGSFGAGFGYSATRLPVGQWAHVALVYDEDSTLTKNTLKIYLNGVLSYTWNAGSSRLQNVGPKLTIGGYSADLANTSYRWHGSFDELRIYHAVRTEAQVLADMNNYGPVDDSGLVAYYDFNDSSLTQSEMFVLAQRIGKYLHSDLRSEFLRLSTVLRSDLESGRPENSLRAIEQMQALVSQVTLESSSGNEDQDFKEFLENWGKLVRIESNLEQQVMPAHVKLTAFEVVREALADVVRHGDASWIKINAQQLGPGLQLSIESDGKLTEVEKSGLGSKLLDRVAPNNWSRNFGEAGAVRLVVTLRGSQGEESAGYTLI